MIHLPQTGIVLLTADTHCRTDILDKIKAKHPEITTRFHIGDLFSFVDERGRIQIEGNKETGEWLKKNIYDWYWLMGNHDHVTCREWWKYNIDQETYNLVAGNFRITYELMLGDKKYLLVHSKPKSLWDFINPGEYTYRDFCEDFPDHEDFAQIIGSHTHREAIHNFVDTDTQIVQIGAVRDGKYAILTDKGVEFKRLKT